MDTPDPITFGLSLWAVFKATVWRLLLLAPFVYGVYFLLTLPWRRRERAALVLDLLELGLRDGRSPAETLAAVSRTHDGRLPVRLHLLAAYLEQGLPLDAALARVPRLLPPPVRMMLETGVRHGRLDRTLAACRGCLGEPLGPAQAAIHYLVLLVCLAGLWQISTATLLRRAVLPKFSSLMEDLADGYDAGMELTLTLAGWGFMGATVGALLIYLWLFARIGGPRLLGFRHWWDRLLMRVPWRRARMQRDFAAMLALLLDSGVPEETAVLEAAAATANTVMIRRARRTAEDLRAGIPLPQAVRRLDPAGEIRWRLENAHHGQLSRGKLDFTTTLQGWLRALDSRAQQQETMAAQLLICSVILLSGLAVGMQSATLFGWLVRITEAQL